VKGVVAAGHPLTAEAGADVLREGGNAVDAAVAAVLASFATESPLTGFGAGGFMLVHDPTAEPVLIDFFVQAPGLGGVERGAELEPVVIYFDDTPQTFYIGAPSCGVPGTPAGLAHALGRFGTAPMAELVKPAIDLAWGGLPVNAMQSYIFQLLTPILNRYEEGQAIYAPRGSTLVEGDTFKFPELAEALERYGAEGADPFYEGEIGTALADWVAESGGTLSHEDLAAYEPIEREPVRARFRGSEVLTNPPPSSGGLLIALCLELLERVGESGVEAMVGAMRTAQESRGERFQEGLHEEDFAGLFLDPSDLDERASRLGSTTHLSVLDENGMCASVTCSNGSGSGVVVPGTGVALNNMLGEEDLNPLGFHRSEPGRRITSMMAPTLVMRDGSVVAGLGSAGSNRIRSAILQTVVRLVADRSSADDAVRAPRVHYEDGVVQAEPGVDELALVRLEEAGFAVARWRNTNLYFGGVQAVARDAGGRFEGGGDPRRGGAFVVVD
jgi:gamma-glutamyltranspeptidase/glutathione hydrolase